MTTPANITSSSAPIATNKLLNPQTGVLAVAPNPTGGQGIALTANGQIPASLNPMTLLQKKTVAAAGTVTFSPISPFSATFNHLMIVWNCGANGAAETQLRMTFNNDTGAHYWWGIIEQNNAVSNVAGANADTAMAVGITGTSSAYFSGLISIPMYRSTIGTHAVSSNYAGFAVANRSGTAGGFWNGNAIVTRIDLTAGGGNFATASNFYLYGL